MAFGDLSINEYWNAATNTPKLVSGRGIHGKGYLVGTAGTTVIDGNTDWNRGDIVIFILDQWLKFVNGGSGGGGGGISPASVKYYYVTATRDVDAGGVYYVDTSAAAFPLNLAASPADGDGMSFRDARGKWGTNNLTINPGANKINSVATPLVCNTDYLNFDLLWRGGSIGWEVEFVVGSYTTPSAGGGGGGGGLDPLVHWDPLAQAPSIILSGGKLTATGTANEGGSSVLGNQTGSQNRYFEVTGTGNCGAGLANNAQGLVGTYPGADNTNGFGYFHDGYAQGPGVAGTVSTAWGTAVIGILYLPTSNQLKVYKGGALVGTYAAPAVGTGVFPVGYVQTVGSTITLNGGASPLSFLPAGATSWDGTQS